MPGRRLLIGGLLATGVVVWLVTGGSIAPAGPAHLGTQASATSVASGSALVALPATDVPVPSGVASLTSRFSGSTGAEWSPALSGATWSTTGTSATTGTTSPSSTTQSTSTATTVRKEILVATMPTSGAPASLKPGGPTKLHIPGYWLHARSILPVLGMQGNWVHVRLAQRPNGSTAWVRSRYVVRWNTDPFHIVIDLSSTHMHLYKEGKQIGYYPLGVGLPQYPTPRGHFFVALFTAAPSPAWGAFVILTSAHSNVLTDWEATGDGIVGIHGPLGADAQIGTTGARVSHGCIRMHKAQLLHLRPVGIGTPIDIHW